MERTEDGRYVIINGRRWRATDPEIPEEVAARLRKSLMAARREVGVLTRQGKDPAPARSKVQAAKVALGERGTPWWEQSPAERRQRWELLSDDASAD
ncbi:hypothetical protein ACTI_53270 [Actinoplanes sp. OR16]|uniref:hypothetical protein n=1 Tax=Actinoplanes sp. OR16 TaxID=946334 RepID=UPI000F70A1A7|nr:hypothetical protein [Actinoplanes sp. OR16]BBH68642.1 hypothetical protein ACTI_53270 [Actinoplanes sp. OR16]